MKEVAGQLTREVCGLFDVQLLSDLGDDEKPVYFLGWPSEPNAGLIGGELTPSFASLEELEKHCSRFIDRFRKESSYDQIPYSGDWA